MRTRRTRSALTRRLRHTAVAIAVVAAIGAGSAPHARAELPLGVYNLTRVYKGNDSSLLYTRAVGPKVVGYAERPGALAFLFEGTLVGNVILGRWWDLPEAKRGESGTLSLSVASGGASLTRTGGDDPGPDSWVAVARTEAGYNGFRPPAGFQAIAPGDLDGAYNGSDGSRAYVRETGDKVVWVSDQGQTADGLPAVMTAFIGKRIGAGTVEGSFYDLPIGARQRFGTFAATQDPDRSFLVPVKGTDGIFFGAVDYTPEYAVDYDRFAQEIRDRFENKVVGYSYAIAARGGVVRTGAGGWRSVRQPDDDPFEVSFPFQTATENEMASTTKTVTAVAVAQALEKRGISIDSPVHPYLPSQWARGEGMETVTFRQLLHHDGLRHPGKVCGSDPYKCLKEAVASGMTASPGYNNIHYTVMRVILPFVVDGPAMKAAFASHDVDEDGDELNEIFSQSFRSYVRGMLMSVGVSADFAYQTANVAMRYSFGPPATNEWFPEDHESHYLEAGSGGLKMTAGEYAHFLTAFDRGALVSPKMVRTLKNGRLGFDDLDANFTGSGALGPLYVKNGATSRGGANAISQSLIAPSGVQVFVTMTGSGHPAGTSQAELLRAAYEAALV